MPDLEGTLDAEGLTVWELVIAVAVVIIAGLVARVVRRRIRGYLEEASGLEEGMPDLLGRMAGWIIMFLGVLVALTVLGFDTGGIVLLVAVVAIVVVFAGKGIMENFAAGLVLQIRGPFVVGDRIESKGYTGVVQEINARSTVIETGDRRTVHIPNMDVLDDPIVNYTAKPIRRSEVAVGITYEADAADAMGLLVSTAARVEGVHAEPAPRAFIDEFADSSVNLIVQFWHDDGERIVVRGRVSEAVKTSLDAAGIEIPFPQRVVTLEGATAQPSAE